MARILVIGDVGGFGGDYHVGDEAMWQCVVDLLRGDGWEVVAVSRNPGRTGGDASVEAVPPLPFVECRCEGEREALYGTVVAGSNGSARGTWPALDALEECDALLVAGGGNLNSTWPALLYERVALLEACRRMEKPRVLTGQTIGPHLRLRELELVAESLRGAGLVGVRESASRDLVTRLGTAVGESLSISLQMDDAAFMAPEAPEEVPAWIDDEWIALTLTEPGSAARALAPELDRLAESTEARLVFLPHAGDPQPDARVVEDLETGLRARLEVLPIPTARQAAWWAGKASLVLSSRYHPVVFGLSRGTPSLALFADEYTRIKARGGLGWWGLESWSLPLDLAERILAEAAIELWSRREEIREHLVRSAPRLRDWRAEHEERIRRALEGRKWQPSGDPEPDRIEARGSWPRLGALTAARPGELYRELWDYQARTVAATRYARSLREHLDGKLAELASVRDLLAGGDRGVP